jgi:hypothetical protein
LTAVVTSDDIALAFHYRAGWNQNTTG